MGTHEHAACNAHVRAWQQRNNMRVCSFGLAIRATLVHTSACTSMVRAKNTADDESVVKLLRSNMTSLGDGFKSSCIDTVLASYESFLLDFLLISSRFSAAQLSRCAGKAFEGVCDKDCGLFGRQLSHALSYARVKSKSLTSGAKTHKSTRRIIQAIGKQENAEFLPKPGVHVWRGAGKSPSRKRAKTQEAASSSARTASSKSVVEVTGKEDIYKMYGLDDVAVGGPVLLLCWILTASTS